MSVRPPSHRCKCKIKSEENGDDLEFMDEIMNFNTYGYMSGLNDAMNI